MPSGKHSAAAAALGYTYQTAWCLLELLRRGNGRPDAAISLEMHDDVAWDNDGTPEDLLSLKHHTTPGSLTDMHDDVWTTIRVWMNTGSPADPYGPALTLVTTSTGAAGSAAAVLRDDADRDEHTALERLRAAAAASKSRGTADVRARFLALTDAEARTFVSRMLIADASPTVSDIDKEVEDALWWALPAGHEETFLALLWRWWYGAALDMLEHKRGPVDVAQARAQISWLRDQFGDDTLPTLVFLADVEEDVVVAAHTSRRFVEQMRWVRYATRNLRRAIVDYHRAVTQATSWLDQDLVALDELTRFRDNLRDEWGRAFDDMVDDLGEEPDEATKVAMGKDLLRGLLASTVVNVRTRYNDPFFARGIRHELADGGRIGWHPDFEARLEELLTATA